MKITIDGVEIDAQKLIDQGWTPPEKKHEVTELHKGCVIEVSHFGNKWFLETLTRIAPNGFVAGNEVWQHARLIREPLPVAMIPWSGGECPVPSGTPTMVVLRGGDITATKKPEAFLWENTGAESNIIAYLPLDLRMPEASDG